MRTWHRGSPTGYGIDVYTSGDCWVLAFYLAKKLNVDVAFIGGRRDWGHACVKVGRRYLDIEGWHTKKGLEHYAWRNPNKVEFASVADLSFKQYRALVSDHSSLSEYKNPDGLYSLWVYYDEFSNPLRVASQNADRLIDKYGLRGLTIA